MSVIWSGITEQGAVVPVQVDDSGKVIATVGTDGGFVRISGDVMTGPLFLSGDPEGDLQAATKKYVDSNAGTPYFAAGRFDAIGGTESAFNCSCRSDELGVYQLSFDQRPNNNLYVIQITADHRPNRLTTNCTYDSGSLNSAGFLYYLHDISTGFKQANAHSVVVFAI